MVKFWFKRSIFRICEMAFGGLSDCTQRKCDVVYMHSNDVVEGNRKIISKSQHTLINDLDEHEEELFAQIKKNCKYEIRRAEREYAQCHFFDSKEMLIDERIVEEFSTIYNTMFRTKGLSGYSFNMPLVKAGIASNQVVITTCNDSNDEKLKVYHAYLCDGNSCVLMYSASPVWNNPDKEQVNAIGRMNKLLHWNDIKMFKEKGYKRYEWGGISDVDNPNGIDKFKMEFGGTIKQYFNYIVPCSLLGYVYIILLKWRER